MNDIWTDYARFAKEQKINKPQKRFRGRMAHIYKLPLKLPKTTQIKIKIFRIHMEINLQSLVYVRATKVVISESVQQKNKACSALP